MTPVKQGLYEFRKDSLIEIRKGMGISQVKMAELLGVPANTLSRWETGATVPDAVSLATIYSLATEHGMTPPSFFGIRSSPLELSLSSKPSDQLADIVAFLQSFRNYLNTHINLIGSELAPVIRIEVSNTAPVTQSWPKIVFTGVGLSLANTADRGGLLPRPRMPANRKPEDKTDQTTATPWQSDSKRESFLKIAYFRTDQKEFPNITSDEAQHGEVLFPGQSVIYEMDITPEILPYLQFRIEGTVSRRHLFHCEETFVMPQNITRPLALSAFFDFNAIDIYGPLESVVNSIPKIDSDTRLTEVQAFSTVLSSNMAKIKATQEKLNDVFRQHKFGWFRAHIRAAFIFLDRVNAALARMNQAIESANLDKIATEASSIQALRGEAIQLRSETQALMGKYSITEEEIQTLKFEAAKTVPGTALQLEAEQS
ncbi:MAG: helix-turn-helix transcriptional regulator [Chloroflexi bacterium]|nr:helix-turn-helix transcriptional regulator [Chloroflexota bacterium]